MLDSARAHRGRSAAWPAFWERAPRLAPRLANATPGHGCRAALLAWRLVTGGGRPHPRWCATSSGCSAASSPCPGTVDPSGLRHHRLLQGGQRPHLQGRAVRGAGGAIHLRPRCAMATTTPTSWRRSARSDVRDRCQSSSASSKCTGTPMMQKGDTAPRRRRSRAPCSDLRRRHPGWAGRGLRQPAAAAGGGRPRSGSDRSCLAIAVYFAFALSAARGARPHARRAEAARGGAEGAEHALRRRHQQHVAGPVPVRRRAARGVRQPALCRDVRPRAGAGEAAARRCARSSRRAPPRASTATSMPQVRRRGRRQLPPGRSRRSSSWPTAGSSPSCAGRWPTAAWSARTRTSPSARRSTRGWPSRTISSSSARRSSRRRTSASTRH